MKKSIENDLKDLSVIMEELVATKDKLPEKDLIDIAAFLKPIAKACETIDDQVKDTVKEKLNHREGSRLGGLFKAVLKLVPVERLDQKALKEGSPTIHKKYLKDYEDERITFELR